MTAIAGKVSMFQVPENIYTLPPLPPWGYQKTLSSGPWTPTMDRVHELLQDLSSKSKFGSVNLVTVSPISTLVLNTPTLK